MNVDQLVLNATALSKSLGTAASDFAAALAGMRDEALALEADLSDKRAKAQIEIERLDAQIAEKEQLHRDFEASLESLRRSIAKERAKIERAIAAA